MGLGAHRLMGKKRLLSPIPPIVAKFKPDLAAINFCCISMMEGSSLPGCSF
jgi:hypothetical protein